MKEREIFSPVVVIILQNARCQLLSTAAPTLIGISISRKKDGGGVGDGAAAGANGGNGSAAV